jgi:hypothetical protein
MVVQHAEQLPQELEAWMPSEIRFISPMVEQLMRLIQAWRCVVGNEFPVELALRAALNNAVVPRNGMAHNELVDVRCRCERLHVSANSTARSRHHYRRMH